MEDKDSGEPQEPRNTPQMPGRRPKKIKWDEATIAEHDKERGTRQKIEEPDTPFYHPEEDGYVEDDEGDAPEAEAETQVAAGVSEERRDAPVTTPAAPAGFAIDLNSKLNDLAENAEESGAVPLEAKWETAEEEEERKRRFKAKRNAHYNEMEMLRKWKAENAPDPNEEDGMEEEENVAALEDVAERRN